MVREVLALLPFTYKKKKSQRKGILKENHGFNRFYRAKTDGI